MSNIPDEVNSPCCRLLRTYIAHIDRSLLVRVIHIAKSLYGWRCRIFAFPPKWHLYIAWDDLNEQQIVEVKQRRGPVVVLNAVLRELVAK